MAGWFQSVKNPKLKKLKRREVNSSNSEVDNPHWKKCVSCRELVAIEKLEENLSICPYCSHHYRLSAKDRLKTLVDKDSFKEELVNTKTQNPLGFYDKKSYDERLDQAQSKTGARESSIVGLATIDSQKVSLAIMDFFFMGGSMGTVTGEKIAHAMELALQNDCPCIVVSCSGGARMQEGILSLMQMAKISSVRQKLKEKRIPYISILTDPTTGGCAASFAMQGDINIAEPKALIGFAGPRVIEQSIRQKLPEGFQRSEFLKEHGFIDRIVSRDNIKDEVSFFLKMFHYA